MFAAFNRANIRDLTVGLESGSERVRKEILKRYYSNEDMITMVKAARKHGLAIAFQNMIGLPGETEEEFMETVKMNRICQPDKYMLSIFYPYPGTELAHVCEEMGLLDGGIDDRMERMITTLEIPSFPSKRIKHRCVMFHYDVYKGKKPFYNYLPRLLRDKMLYDNPILYNHVRKLPIISTLRNKITTFRGWKKNLHGVEDQVFSDRGVELSS